MKRRRRESDHRMAMAARVTVGVAAVAVGLLFLRSLPDLVRYLKIERM